LSGTYTLFIPPTAISIAFWGVKSGSGLINMNALFGSERLGVYSKMVANSMRSKLLGLLGNKVCTYSDLDELVKRFGKERAIIECYKQNIVVCRDASNVFGLGEGEKMIDVVYFKPDGTPDRMFIRYVPGYEKIRYGTLPIVLAVYEKCLGIKVDR